MKTTEEIITDIAVTYLGLDPALAPSPETTLMELGADSLDKAAMFMAIEEECRVEIIDEEAASIKTLQDAINLVDNLKND